MCRRVCCNNNGQRAILFWLVVVVLVVVEGIDYGVDVSFPIHHGNVSTNYDFLPHNILPALYPTPHLYEDMPIQPLGNRQAVYDDYMQGCVNKFAAKGKFCWEFEEDRVALSLRQPQSMINYTETGFQKIRAPEDVWNLIQKFWQRNQENWKIESWPPGNTYTNHWKAPTYLVGVEDFSLRGGGQSLKEAIWDAARSTIQEWTKQQLTECSLYGIRVYTEGAILNTHVDRLPLVSSAIISVAQDVDEPWPLELIGHDGKAHNVTMEPGDMILYESHSILHGRPFPLKGRYVADLYVHFEPTGHSVKHHNHDTSGDFNSDVHQQYRDSVRSGMGGHEAVDRFNNGLPSYLIPNSPEEANYQQQHHPETKPNMTGTEAHTFAKMGKTDELIELLEDQNHLVHAKDDNGWTPLHEGARAGHVDVVKYLVEKGANVNERSYNGKGGNALFYAFEQHGKDSSVYQFLESIGAVSIDPDPEL